MIFFRFLWRVWFVVLAFLLLIVCAPFALLFSLKTSHFCYAYFFIRLWSLGLFYGMGFRYRLVSQSTEKLDTRQNYILISNHTSMMDIMLMCVLHPHHPICFIGKAELAKIPIFGLIYRRICILVDRNNSKSRAEVYTKAAEKIKAGQSLVIFPEGGVPDDERVILDPFKDGAFSLSAKHEIPIAVYTFIGLKEFFPFRWNAGSPGCIDVIFHGIIQNDTKENLKNTAREMMWSVLKKKE